MELHRVEIPNFIRRVLISEKQRPTYWEWNGAFIKGKKPIPRSFFKDKFTENKEPKLEDLRLDKGLRIVYFNKKKFGAIHKDSSSLPDAKEISEHEGKFILCKVDASGINPMLCNPKKVGTPKYYLIRGQDIYSGNLREFQRGLVMDKIKECYYPFVKALPVIEAVPLRLECELHYPINNPFGRGDQAWDIDNFIYPYFKAFPDLLVTIGKLKNDDRLHISDTGRCKFVPVDKYEDRKLVFIISKDERSCLNDGWYKHYIESKPIFIPDISRPQGGIIDDDPFN